MDKVIDIEERIPSLRERRKKRTNRKFFALLFVLLVLLAILLYSQSKYSEIQNISITGAVLYDTGFYEEASGLSTGDSMWSFREKDVEEQLAGLDWVEQATVTKNWLNGVEIGVKEYEQIGYLDLGNTYQQVLVNGIALDKPVALIDGPIFSNFEDLEARKKLGDQLEKIDSDVQDMISQIILQPEEKDTHFVTLYMNDGNEVRGILNTLAEKLNYYPSVIAQLEEDQKGVIDMEVGIFFRSYDNVYGSAEVVIENEESSEK